MTAEPLDMGRLRVQEALPWTVTIKNPGREPVQVYDLMLSCSCTKIEPMSFIVPAEGSVDVHMTIDLTTLDPEQAARAERTFSAELMPSIRVPEGIRRPRWELYGTIASAIALEPPELVFAETLIRGVPSLGKVVVVRSLEPVESVTVECDAARADVDVSSIEASPGAWEVRVTPSESLPVGLHKFKIYVHTTLRGGESVPALPLPISATVVEDIEFWPRVVLLSARQGGESVSLRSRTNRDFQVVSATPLAQHLIETFRIDPSDEASSVSNWLVSLADTAPERDKGGAIRPTQSDVRFLVRYREGWDVEIALPVRYIEPPAQN